MYFTSKVLNRIRKFVDQIVDVKQQFELFSLDIRMVPLQLTSQIHQDEGEDPMVER
jgi:hypothetical protein